MMRRSVLVALLPLLLVMTGCSDDDEPAGDGTLSLTVDWEPRRLAPGPVTWTVTVVNGTDEDVELDFTTGQRADVTLSRNGDDVYQWSRALFFTQVVGQVRVRAGEEHSFTLDEPGLDVDAGEYRLTAMVTSSSHDLRTTRRVTVRHG